MYEKIFKLKSRPFSAAPDVLQYHSTETAEFARRSCRGVIERHAGPALILGGPGLGKSLLLELLKTGFEGQFQIVTVGCSRTDTRRDLLQNILFQLGRNYREMSESELRLELADYFRQETLCPHGLLCLVDDAHCLAEELLDELRVLSGFVRGGLARCQLVLTGTQRLEELLASPRQESLNQKVSARCYLTPLPQVETAEYVRAQLRRAGAGSREYFSMAALKIVQRLSQGVPRLINQLCDAVLQSTAQRGESIVTPELCQQVWHDLQRLPLDELSPMEPAPADPRSAENPTGSHLPPLPRSTGGLEFGVLSDETESPTGGVWATKDLQRDELTCEGRSSRKCVNRSEAVEPVAEAEYQPVVYPQSVNHGLGAASLKAGLQGRCDLDPDRPDASAPPRLPLPPPSPANNPFEECFETEEVVTEAFLRGSIAHNQAASQLTRAILEEFQVDSFELQTIDRQSAAIAGGETASTTDRTPEFDQVSSQSIYEQVTLPFTFGDRPEMRGETGTKAIAESRGTNQTSFDKPDDRDMLIVSKLNQLVPAPQPMIREEDQSTPSTGSHSTGQALRMDYKQLFSRLRNPVTAAGGETTSSR